MPRQFKTARKMRNLKLLEAANKLGVSQPTLSSWESERKSPTIDSILKMCQLYNVSADFLLGNSVGGGASHDREAEVPKSNFQIMHGQPVWTNEYGWLIVDSINECMIAPDGIKLPFTSEIKVYYKTNEFTEGDLPRTAALSLTELSEYDRVWVEPISANFHLRQELRGWYTVMSDWVENSAGNRFLFDTYESKWLAFPKR